MLSYYKRDHSTAGISSWSFKGQLHLVFPVTVGRLGFTGNSPYGSKDEEEYVKRALSIYNQQNGWEDGAARDHPSDAGCPPTRNGMDVSADLFRNYSGA